MCILFLILGFLRDQLVVRTKLSKDTNDLGPVLGRGAGEDPFVVNSWGEKGCYV